MFTPAVFPQRPGRAKASSKPSCAQNTRPISVPVVHPVVQVPAPADPLPSVSEESADVSMKEEEALCQAFSETLLTVQDVDEQDADQPQLCSQYVKDIYKYLHVLEVVHPLRRSDCRSAWCCTLFSWPSASTGAAGCTSQLHAGLRDH